MNQRYLNHIILFLILIAVSDVFGQEEQALNPAELKQQTAVTEPATLYKGFFRTGMVFNYGFVNLLFDKDGNRVLKENAFGRTVYFSLSAQYGISNRLQAEINIPYINYKMYVNSRQELPELDFYSMEGGEQSGKGLSDMEIALHYQLLKPEYGSRFLTAGVYVIIPTGNSETSEDNLIPPGDGHFAFDFNLEYEKIIYPNRFSAYISYKYNLASMKTAFSNGEYIEQEIQAGGLLSVIGSWDLMLNDWLAIRNQLQFINGFPDKADGEVFEYDYGDQFDSSNKRMISYLPALSFQIKRLRFNQVLHIPLAGKNLSPDPGFTLIVQYVF